MTICFVESIYEEHSFQDKGSINKIKAVHFSFHQYGEREYWQFD